VRIEHVLTLTPSDRPGAVDSGNCGVSRGTGEQAATRLAALAISGRFRLQLSIDIPAARPELEAAGRAQPLIGGA
jgi:hypothetical protein